MIVEHVRAKNFLKYAELQVEDLPSSGLIGISGVNESGKTAIFETVCFGLFGRTFSLEHKKLIKAIKWSEDQAFVQLRFIANDGAHYTVVRTLNNIGRQGARLTRGADNEAVAKGLSAVYANIVQLCGFDFEEFIDSIYLAQQEIGTPYTQGKTIKTIAGVTAMEKASEELKEEIRQGRRTITETSEQLNEANQRLEVLDFDENALTCLEEDNAQGTAAIAGAKKQIGALQTTATALDQALTNVQKQVNHLCTSGTDFHAGAWNAPIEQLEASFNPLQEAGLASGYKGNQSLPAALENFLSDFKPRILAFKGLLGQIDNYQQRLHKTIKSDASGSTQGSSLPTQQAILRKKVTSQLGQRSRTWIGLFFSGIVALTLGAIWLLLGQFPQVPAASELAKRLQAGIPNLDPQSLVYGSLAGAIIFLLLAIFLMVRGRLLSHQIAGKKQQIADLSEQIAGVNNRCNKLADLADKPAPILMTLLRDMEENELHGTLSSFVLGSGSALVNWDKHQELLRSAFDQSSKESAMLRQQGEKAIAEAQNRVTTLQAEIEQRTQTIEIEKGRRSQAFELIRMLTDLQTKIKDHKHRIKVRELGCELLIGTGIQNSQRFNTDLRRFMSRVMPMMTEQRYQYLQLDKQLEVTVFSSEKQDFVGLEEISTGTQRQILLSLRLALSEALVEAAGPGRQCLVLDEPFAFFDQTRIRRALEALPKISGKLSQIWLVAQEFVTHQHFARHIECKRGVDVLESLAEEKTTETA